MRIPGVLIIVAAIAIAVVSVVFNCQAEGQSLTLANGSKVPMKCYWSAMAEIAVTIPLVTEAGTCPTNTFCKGYSMILPAAKPALGTFSLANPSWTAPVAGADYFINGMATQPSGNGQPDCTPSAKTTVAVPVVAGDTKTAAQLDFTGCS